MMRNVEGIPIAKQFSTCTLILKFGSECS